MSDADQALKYYREVEASCARDRCNFVGKCRVRAEALIRKAFADLAAAQAKVKSLESGLAQRDRALAWLASAWASEKHFDLQSAGPNCPLQPKVDLCDRSSCPYTEDGNCAVLRGDMLYRECALRSALAAAEEATP